MPSDATEVQSDWYERGTEQKELLRFGPFHFDLAAKRLWRGNERLRLRPMAAAVLAHFIHQTGRLVPNAELLHAVWGNTRVTRTVIRVCIREIRHILDDDAVKPRYIETVGREGYRFIATLSRPVSRAQPVTAPFVGRARELEQLHQWLGQALMGQRQLVFISGEAGIGKTAVVQRLLESLPATAPVWIGQGQCIEHYGVGEAYSPVLEMLSRLGRETGQERLGDVLRRYAPSWLVQLPALVNDEERATLERRIHGVAQPRMVRELIEALEVLKGKGRKKLSAVSSQLSVPSTQAETEAEACFHQAMAIAQQQGAKSLELRAGMSLARRWQQQGQKAEAHHLLAEIYHWFTEGLDTKDLQEAKALLDELT